MTSKDIKVSLSTVTIRILRFMQFGLENMIVVVITPPYSQGTIIRVPSFNIRKKTLISLG